MVPEENKKHDGLEYDVAFSFAGERREYDREVATELRKNGIKVFYDEYNLGGTPPSSFNGQGILGNPSLCANCFPNFVLQDRKSVV